MAKGSNNGDRASESEVLDEVYGRRADLLESLRFFDGEATAHDMRKESGCPSGSMHHHISQLIEYQLIERVGEKPIGSGGTSDIYRLTDRGDIIVEQVSEESTTAEDVVTLREEIEQHEQAIERQEEIIKDLEESHAEILSTLKTVESFIKSEVDADVIDS